MNDESLDGDFDVQTLLVHAGNPRRNLRPTALSIYPRTSFITDSPEQLDDIMAERVHGHSYARHSNPTVEGLTEAMRLLEHAETVIATGSGMAAIDAALFATGLRAGDTVLLSRDLYGASLNLVGKVWEQYGIVSVVVDLTDLQAVEAALKQLRPKVLLFETVSNPLLKVVDAPALVSMAHDVLCQVVVDSTFTTPLMARPLQYGADLVVHSATKYLGGHGDAMGGVVAGGAKYHDALHQYLKLRGGVLGPFEAWLIHRGLQTLAVRFERQCQSALQLATRLEETGRLRAVYHPFLASHPTVETAKRLLPAHLGGAVVTLELHGQRREAYRFLKALKVVRPATTVGDVYTLCLYPLIASHRNQTEEERRRMGITEGTVRMAIGLEHPDDIYADIVQAIEAAERT